MPDKNRTGRKFNSKQFSIENSNKSIIVTAKESFICNNNTGKQEEKEKRTSHVDIPFTLWHVFGS